MASTEPEQEAATIEAQQERRHRHRRKRRWPGVPAPYVFYTLMLVGLGSIAAVHMLGKICIPVAGVASLLMLGSFYVNDNKGFIRRRQMRRAFEPRRNFNNVEVLLLILLLMGNFFVSALALLG